MNKPIRVLQVVTHMNRGGLETMLMNYYRSIDREKVQFDFLTHRPYDGDYGAEIRQLGGKIYHLPRLNPFSSAYKKELRRFFEQHPEYRIVHVHQDCLSGIVLKEAAACGVPVRIAHSHNANQDKNIKYPIKAFFRRRIARYATGLMACSQEAGAWMFCGAPFTVLNNAINAAQYVYSPQKQAEMRAALGIAESELVIGHVGRWNPQKNHLFLLDIFAQIKARVPQARLLLVGDDQGDYAEQVKEKIRALGLTDAVIATGKRTDVPDLLQAMDVFVMPSHYEGLPVSIVEAQAAGLPCLISDKVPLECKLTVPVQQIALDAGADAWAQAILQTVQHHTRSDQSAQIRAAGFDIAENARWLQDFYQNAAKK